MNGLRARWERRALDRAVAIADLRVLARARLPRALFDFIDGGAEDERTVRANEADFDNWRFMPRVGLDVSRCDLTATILGKQAALPLVIAPTGLAGFFRKDGELHAARAAAKAGIPYTLSTNSVATLERVATEVPDADRWFQLYFLKDREWMAGLVRRAADAKYRVLCLTLDVPLSGRRERDLRNGFNMPLHPRLGTVLDLARRPSWLFDAARSRATFGNFERDDLKGLMSIAQHVATLFDPSANWDDVARLRDQWKGPIAIKGVLRPDDALIAIKLGVDALMVSNHGGRQLDRTPSAIEALPDIAATVGGRIELILDGGVRRGTDIMKACALGASACSIGRAHLWGLAAGGEAGVARVLAMFRRELEVGMALLGTPRLTDISRACLRQAPASR